MTKRRMLAYLAVFLVMVGLLIAISSDKLWERRPDELLEVSVIIRGKNTEIWTTIEQGIDQAALDLNVETTLVSLTEENDAEEQVEMIQREIGNGADAILIAPINDAAVAEAIREARKQIPVVAMESTVPEVSDLPYISGNNQNLGRLIGEEILTKSGSGKVTLIQSNMSSSSTQDRISGLLQYLAQYRVPTDVWNLPSDPLQAYDTARGMLTGQNVPSVVVAFDGSTLEVIAKAQKDLLAQGNRDFTDIYGIGRTNEAVALLEENIISSIAVQNEYNVGYLALQGAVDQIKGKSVKGAVIQLAVVDNTNMYSSENQRLLFPFVR